VLLGGCGHPPGPDPDSPEYAEAVGAFYTGVAAIQVGEDARAERALTRVVELAPREPAAPANLALLAFQQRRLDDAARWIGRARSEGADDPRLALLAALVARERGRLDEAIGELTPVADANTADADTADADTPDPRVAFLLSRLREERGEEGDVAASRRLLDRLYEADPDDLFLRVERARHAARHGDPALLAEAVDRLDSAAEGWPAPLREQLRRVRAALQRPGDAGVELTVLSASLEALPSYVRDREALAISDQQPDLVFTGFVRLPTPSPRPAPPDREMTFARRAVGGPGPGLDGADAAAPVPARPTGPWREVRPVWLGDAEAARVALIGPDTVWLVGDTAEARRFALPVARGSGEAPVTLAALDLDRDFRMDVAVAGSGGLLLLRQRDDGDFVALDPAAVPASVRGRPYTDAWPADTDMDGDVDLVLVPRGGAPFVLRNRGDGTFGVEAPFDGPTGARAFVWGDLDHDGDPDAAFLAADGRLWVFANPRQDRPRFDRLELPDGLEPARALALGDLDGDARFDLLVLRADGALVHAERNAEGWETRDVGRWPEPPPEADDARLFLADLDDNGALDVVASAGGRTQVWLGDGDRGLVPHHALDVTVTAVADLTGGRVELLGTGEEGAAIRLAPRRTLDYYALTVRPRATDQPGDGRINSFGLGGEAEIRAGMLYQKQPITQPFVHFGIGSNTGVTVARILWPNGTAQAEFDLLATSEGETIVARQRLKGSCPWLFAYDGRDMRFVTDVAWRTALGLRINTYGPSSVIQSQDWVRIRGEQLQPRDGAYELSITAELWESHFFDQVALMVVDHPAGTEALVDERFLIPAPELKVHGTGPLRPLVAAHDDRGRDVRARVDSLDERYVDGFELGEYQGVARREHAVEVDLGPDAPSEAPLVLVAQGWVYPTDGSINLALGQGSHAPPRGIRVEVPDGAGGWRVLHPDLGMPSGKTKTVLVDLSGAFGEGMPRRVRLATTMEIYWDRIAWAEARPDTELRTNVLRADVAELRFRGFSRTRQAGRRAPELPEWDVATTAPPWRDLEGYYTRFGDVRALVEAFDDRYVIMNAGDELRLRFAALPEPPAGWVRDYVLISEAWIKDGDVNNGFSGGLRPLPYRGMTDYATAPGRLEDDPAVRRHPDDWREYHTRYITPRRFIHALSHR
jgi:hypothetical protein